MAYEALDNLQQTLDQILNHHDHLIITPTVKQEILSIRIQAVVLQINLKNYPHKQRINEEANTAYEIIEYLFSEEHHSDSGGIGLSERLSHKLRELAGKLESTAGDVLDYINGARPPPDSQAVGSSSRPAALASKDVVVGFDDDVKVIKDRLVEGSSRLQVLPIVGTGGIGKTTLAKTIYNDAMIVKHFDIQGWVTVSQDYSVASIVSTLLASMKGISTQRDVEGEIPMDCLVRKCLHRGTYLIVMDDICSQKAWDDLRILFPDDHNGSQIIVTTRLEEVAAYVASSRYIHTMRLLDAHHSWNLLTQKVFADKDFPLQFEDIGRKIVKNCGGLPLSIVLVAGLLSKIHTRDSWKQIAANGAQLETNISLSYAHLPDDSKPCLLYMAGFPEKYEIHVSELIKLWIVEGFLTRSNESKSLEEEAEDRLEDLVERSLVLASTKKFNGKIKSCSLHDIVRDFCVRQARKEKVILPVMDYLPTPILRRHFLPRLIKDHPRISATSYDLHLKDSLHNSHSRTIICIPKKGYRPVGSVERFDSLRVLHVLHRSNDWDWEPGRVFDLIHLSYLASNIPNRIVPSTISNLQNLQTFIIYRSEVHLPEEIWRLRHLRHLIAFSFHPLPHPKENTSPLENLETLSRVTDFMCSESMVQMIPNIKKLGICCSKEKFDPGYRLNNLKHLCRLEKLKLEMCEDFSLRQLDKLEMEYRGFHLLQRLDGLERQLDELELMRGNFRSTSSDQFSVDGRVSSRQLNQFEHDIHGGFLSRQLDQFLGMHGRFLSIQLDEFMQEMRRGFLYRHPDDLGLEMCGGFTFRLVDKILRCISFRRVGNILVIGLNHVFPLVLRRLTLSGCMLSWSDMPVIGSLPNLQVLKLRNYACSGLRWKTIEGEFGELRLLLIERSTLRYWRTHGSHVLPKLEFIMLHGCPLLSELPSEIGGIPTLKLIEVDERHKVLLRSAKAIVQKQRNSGNDSFQVRVKRS